MPAPSCGHRLRTGMRACSQRRWRPPSARRSTSTSIRCCGRRWSRATAAAMAPALAASAAGMRTSAWQARCSWPRSQLQATSSSPPLHRCACHGRAEVPALCCCWLCRVQQSPAFAATQVVTTQIQAQCKQKQRLQQQGRPAGHIATGTWAVVRQLHEEGGLRAFWKGGAPPIPQRQPGRL